MKVEPWRTVALGTGVDLMKALKRARMRVSPWARKLLANRALRVARKPTELALARVTAKQLGFAKGARLGTIYRRLPRLGLALCPAEAGPQLRLQYPDQPRAEYLRIAMAPIRDDEGHALVFGVDHGPDGLWIGAPHGGADWWWRADELGVVAVAPPTPTRPRRRRPARSR
ncbi:MAG TPA: hypothetical protein VMJ10_02085 [Kofleriaceae bacterium]|nr:hypothetical protein [Kofleriaceae bacterium]